MLAEAGRRVLLVDCDPQANLSEAFGWGEERPGERIEDLLANPRGGSHYTPPRALPADLAAPPAWADALRIIPATDALADIAADLPGLVGPGYEHRLAEVLKPLRDRFDVVLLDTPPGRGNLSGMAVLAADGLLTVAAAGVALGDRVATRRLGMTNHDPIGSPTFDCYTGLGCKGLIIVADGSFEALQGTFTPHQAPSAQPIPIVIVDRDTGGTLIEQAIAGRTAKLTLDVPAAESTIRSITAILPGASDQTIIAASHSDGQNAVEENGGIVLLNMARHFASLPPSQRLHRTLVFPIWVAHMSDPTFQPELDGWMAEHPDLVKKAVAGIHIEHLGCLEWLDDPVKGYYGTGENEVTGIWTTQGPTEALAQPLLAKYGLDRHALLHGPLVETPGEPLQAGGIPNLSAISGPTYLLVISESGEIEKLDFDLASRQTAFYAEVISQFDTADPATLRTGDPNLGKASVNAGTLVNPNPSITVPDGPANVFITDDGHGDRLSIRFLGLREFRRQVLVSVEALDNSVGSLTVQLLRGKTRVAASAKFTAATGKTTAVRLFRHDSKRFSTGTYTLVISEKGRVLVRQSVHLRA